MKKLTKLQLKLKAELVERINRLQDELNSAIQEAEDLRLEVHDAQEEYFNDRSEKWQEGDVGTAYSEWMSEWDTELEQIECEVLPNLEGMPDEFEG